MGKAFGVANRKVSERVVSRAGPAVKGLSSPGGGLAQSGIKASSKQNAAVVRLLGSNPTLFANVFGTLSHKVFGRNVSGSGPWKPWLGRSWSPEDLHGIGPVIRDVADGFALDEYMDALLDAVSAAFPD
jgi:hypothetical protein